MFPSCRAVTGVRFSHLRRLFTVGAVALASAFAGMAATDGAAYANSSSNALLISNASWLNVAVRGGSNAQGTDILQWTATSGPEQHWNIGPDGNGYYFQNVNSGLCITVVGDAGAPLTQEPCGAVEARFQEWDASYVWWAAGYTLYNPASGLDMDVQGFSHYAGAEIDGWYPNNQLNQVFSDPEGAVL